VHQEYNLEAKTSGQVVSLTTHHNQAMHWLTYYTRLPCFQATCIFTNISQTINAGLSTICESGAGAMQSKAEGLPCRKRIGYTSNAKDVKVPI
jgi:hypothetical protein